MTPADDRVLQLLQKWQKSLDLHARYADLPEDQYWLVQPWPNHQRPTKWVVDLARQRLATCRTSSRRGSPRPILRSRKRSS